MNLLSVDKVTLLFGEQIIFDQLSLQIKKGERLCLVGRNGVGKSTLIKTLEGLVEVDSGSIWRSPNCRIASLNQELPELDDASVYDFVAGGLEGLGEDLARYSALIADGSVEAMEELGQVQQRIESQGGWSAQNQIEQVLTRLDLVGDNKMSDLSGGWRRRAALARALVCKPDLLLLDEPTNHLDILAIEWLEKQLVEFSGAVVFITHDRTFLRKVATSIGELDRGQLAIWQGDYSSFLDFRAQTLADEEKRNEEFDKKLAQEEAWIRKGIKARRTRNEGRVRALKALRKEFSERQSRIGNVNMTLSTENLSGKLVAEFDSVTFGWSDTPIVKEFSCTLLRGDKIGLIGPNGVGKSTFLKLLLGELKPTEGRIQLGSKLSIAYFDQLRDELDLDRSAADNISQGRDFIEIDGKNKHIIGYLNDFLFTGERARTPLRVLSGGERNRVLLAKLFSKSANCLVMDEPTNDLDAETLELLEDLLVQYKGTLLLVSHDREFLDNVVTSTIGFEGGGNIKGYVGGYQDWVRQGGVWPDVHSAPGAAVTATQAPVKNTYSESDSQPLQEQKKAQNTPKKLSYKLQKELESLPAKIEKMEASVAALQNIVCDSGFYQQEQDEINAVTSQLEEQENSLNTLYQRWEELEALKEGG